MRFTRIFLFLLIESIHSLVTASQPQKACLRVNTSHRPFSGISFRVHISSSARPSCGRGWNLPAFCMDVVFILFTMIFTHSFTRVSTRLTAEANVTKVSANNSRYFSRFVSKIRALVFCNNSTGNCVTTHVQCGLFFGRDGEGGGERGRGRRRFLSRANSSTKYCRSDLLEQYVFVSFSYSFLGWEDV